jgi:5'-nucleotidase
MMVNGERLTVNGRGLALLLLCACGPNPQVPAPNPRSGLAVTILHINDIYEISPVEGGKAGGLARVATLLQRLKTEDPSTRMFLGGDFLSPSAIGTARVNGERLAGRQMVAVLNAAGLALATFGNHEFDLSLTDLAKRVAESRFAYVSTNVTDSLGAPLFAVPRHLILQLTDTRGRLARIGVVAATIDQVRKPNLRYQPPIAALRSEIALIKDSVDAVVALTHLTLAGDTQLADSIPALDLILGGHEHENWSVRRGARFTPIVKADANVRSVAIVHLDIRPGTRAAVDWRIVTITDSIPEDPAVSAVVKQWTGLAYDAFRQDGLDPDRQVAIIPAALDAREAIIRNGENPFTRLLTAAFHAAAPDAEVALVNSGSVRLDDVLPEGPITEYDVIRILPFGGKAVVVEMTGALLKRTLDQGDANRGIGGFLLKDGAEYAARGWQIGATPLDTLKRYIVVAPDFLLSGGEQNMSWLSERNPGFRLLRTLADVRLILIDELRRRFPPR